MDRTDEMEFVLLGICLRMGKVPDGLALEGMMHYKVRAILRGLANGDRKPLEDYLAGHGVNLTGEEKATDTIIRRMGERLKKNHQRRFGEELADAAKVMTPEKFREFVLETMGKE